MSAGRGRVISARGAPGGRSSSTATTATCCRWQAGEREAKAGALVDDVLVLGHGNDDPLRDVPVAAREDAELRLFALITESPSCRRTATVAVLAGWAERRTETTAESPSPISQIGGRNQDALLRRAAIADAAKLAVASLGIVERTVGAHRQIDGSAQSGLESGGSAR